MFLTNLSKDNRHRTINNWLTLVVVSASLYLIVFPFLPYLSLWRDKATDTTNGVVYAGILAEKTDVAPEKLAPPPDGYRLVLPSLSFNEEIVIGEDPNNVHLGVWHRPNTSTPDKGGNTVLVGHRFSYSDPAVFYHLDKLRLGERFTIWWDKNEYVYEVFNIEVVPDTALEVEANTDEPIATLYTCTPLWTAENRLVVRGRLINLSVLDKDEDL